MSFEFFYPEDSMRTSSFEEINDIGNWVNKWYTEIEMYMVFFHTAGYRCDVEFFTDSFDDFLC